MALELTEQTRETLARYGVDADELDGTREQFEDVMAQAIDRLIANAAAPPPPGFRDEFLASSMVLFDALDFLGDREARRVLDKVGEFDPARPLRLSQLTRAALGRRAGRRRSRWLTGRTRPRGARARRAHRDRGPPADGDDRPRPDVDPAPFWWWLW